ncbi:MAG: glutathione S-transferase family protein [Minwuia sp.]|nr:glutathione S-transferase family protein [Minwuia sp.]
MLKIWGRTNSINVQKAMWTIGELGLEHEHTTVGGPHGGLDTPEYVAMNPNRRVPVLLDGDLAIWESNAIVRYLCARHSAGKLWASDPGQRSLADRWMDWQAASTIADMTTVFFGLIRLPEAERNMDAINAATGRVNDQMGILDAQLQSSEWVAGKAMSMGDLAVGALVYRWSELPIDRPDLPAVAAYYARLSERPAYRQHVMIPLS